jgi:hypothetical protein
MMMGLVTYHSWGVIAGVLCLQDGVVAGVLLC